MRVFRAGETVEELCRACKIDRLHTIIAVDQAGRPLRVQCDYCGSQHNSRGGTAPAGAGRKEQDSRPVQSRTEGKPVLSVVPARERAGEPIMPDTPENPDLESLLRRVIREEAGVTAVAPAEKWRGGLLVLKPGKPALQEKSWPIDTFFHKIVMIRNRLRTLEQQVNAMNIAEDEKVRLQAYITGCYGSLSSFNVLFAAADDQFKGTGGD